MSATEPNRGRTRLARETRREQIVDAAAEVFRGRDAAEVTFEEIADAAGVSRALVYNYFGDRHGLLEAVYRRHLDELQAKVVEALASTRGAREALRRAVDVHLEFASTDPTGYRYAAGKTPFAGLADAQRDEVRGLANVYGGSGEAVLVARGVITAAREMVLQWLDDGCLDRDQACAVISAFLWGGLFEAHPLGLTLQPTWPVPV
jgi:AcrR family transcriptional regulator